MPEKIYGKHLGWTEPLLRFEKKELLRQLEGQEVMYARCAAVIVWSLTFPRPENPKGPTITEQ